MFIVFRENAIFPQLHYNSSIKIMQYIKVSKSILFLEDFNTRWSSTKNRLSKDLSTTLKVTKWERHFDWSEA